MNSTAAPTRNHTPLLVAASGATFLAMLDSTVTNLALPALGDEFPSASIADLSWVITAYLVLFSALLASAGRLSDVVGRRAVFLTGVGIFTVTSVVCALAPTLAVLIGGRALQGIGASLMIPSALAIMLLDGPPDKRPRAIALWGAMAALAAAVGPSAGGVLIEAFGWQSVFLINVPLGLAMMAVVWGRVPRAEAGGNRQWPDPLGTVLLAGGVGAVVLGVTQGDQWGWGDTRTLGCIVGGAVAVALAVWRSTQQAVPAVETQLWESRSFRTTNVVSFLYGLAQYPQLLVTVLAIVDLWAYTSLEAGFAMTPGAVVASVVALSVGRVRSRLQNPRLAVAVGFTGFFLAALWMMVALRDEAAFVTLLLPTGLLAGASMALITFGTSMAAVMSVPPTRFAGASGMNTMARQVGGALGVAILAVILASSGEGVLDGYRNVYGFVVAMCVLALVVTVAAFRPAPPAAPAAAPAAPAPSEATAAGAAETGPTPGETAGDAAAVADDAAAPDAVDADTDGAVDGVPARSATPASGTS